MRIPGLVRCRSYLAAFSCLGMFLVEPASAACSGQTITPLSLNGNDYVSGGVVSDNPGGRLDLCGILNQSSIPASTEVRLTVELTQEAKFGATPSLSVTGGYTVNLFNGGNQFDFVTWRLLPNGSSPTPANQTFSVDVSSVVVQGPETIEVTVYSQISDRFGSTDLSRVSTNYIVFSNLTDRDGDSVGDVLDNCPDVSNSDQIDTDGDEKGNACDEDDDGDGIRDDLDAFPLDSNESKDSDGDGVGDKTDEFPFDSSETLDSDNDGVGDNEDAFPNDADEVSDSDGDGLGNNADDDDDNDGVLDALDDFPNDPDESIDSDGDGVGNNTDGDDDGDGVPDSEDEFPLDPSRAASFIGRVFLQTTSNSPNMSVTHLINTALVPQRFVGTLYASSGEWMGQKDFPLHEGEIQPRERLTIFSEDIETALNISPWRGPAMLEVLGSGPFELMTKLTSPSGLVSNTNCVRRYQVHNIGGFDQTDVTYVRFINIGDDPITNIRGSLYDDAGAVVGQTNSVLIDELPAKAHVWRNRNQLSDIAGDTWNGTASLKIDNPDENLRLLNLNYINSETFFNFSCYEKGQ